MTEYFEFADLTIKELHKHPASSEKQLPVPALWWENVTEWPPIIRYIPEAPIDIQLPPDEMDDLAAFQKLVARVQTEFLREKEVDTLDFGPILTGRESMNELRTQGNPWLRGSYAFQEWGIPLPLHPSFGISVAVYQQ